MGGARSRRTTSKMKESGPQGKDNPAATMRTRMYLGGGKDKKRGGEKREKDRERGVDLLFPSEFLLPDLTESWVTARGAEGSVARIGA